MHPDDSKGLYVMSDADFEALEAVLASEDVPEDCMDLEMLDGFLAGVLSAPHPVELKKWLPLVWSAHGEAASFGRGSKVQRAIRLVCAYYNELVSTLGLEGEEGWQPFCFAQDEEEGGLKLGEAWAEGFAQGLECWGEDWDEGLPEAAATYARECIEAALMPFADEEAQYVTDQATRLAWLEDAGEEVVSLFASWRESGIAPPALLPLDGGEAPSASPDIGRNEPCSCGSEKKFKKCCGDTCDDACEDI